MADFRAARESEQKQPTLACSVQVIEGKVHLIFDGLVNLSDLRDGKFNEKTGKKSSDYMVLVTDSSFPVVVTDAESGESEVVTVPARRAINLPVR